MFVYKIRYNKLGELATHFWILHTIWNKRCLITFSEFTFVSLSVYCQYVFKHDDS